MSANNKSSENILVPLVYGSICGGKLGAVCIEIFSSPLFCKKKQWTLDSKF